MKSVETRGWGLENAAANKAGYRQYSRGLHRKGHAKPPASVHALSKGCFRWAGLAAAAPAAAVPAAWQQPLGAAQCQAGVRDGGSCRSAERGLACNDLVLWGEGTQPAAGQQAHPACCYLAVWPSAGAGCHQPSVSSSTCSAFSALGRWRASGDRQAAINSTKTCTGREAGGGKVAG